MLQWISGFLHNRTQFVAINGSHSSISPVTSGVPQGSVLGPTLFLLYINDIVDVTKSELRLFADDTVLYRAIKSDHDHQILQEDLHNLTKWASDWQMDFNASKCHLLRITNKRKPFQSTYSVNSEVLAKVPQCDYLGVRCSESLRWGVHCSKVAAKANKTLGLIRRTLFKAMLQRGKGESLHGAGETDHRICIIHLESSHQHRCKLPRASAEECCPFCV